MANAALSPVLVFDPGSRQRLNSNFWEDTNNFKSLKLQRLDIVNLQIEPAHAKTNQVAFFDQNHFFELSESTFSYKKKAKNRFKKSFSKVKLWAFDVCYLTRL